MIISPQVKANLDSAIHSELFASNLYKHVANQLQRLGWFGAQKFFSEESATELTHYQKLVDYINDVGSVAKVPMIEAMTDVITDLQDAIQLGYDTEKQLLDDYLDWYKSSDAMTQQFLLQFIEIQRTSVGEYGDLLSRLKLASGDKCAMLLIDQEFKG